MTFTFICKLFKQTKFNLVLVNTNLTCISTTIIILFLNFDLNLKK